MSRKRILIIDDRPLIISSLMKYFVSEEYDVIITNSSVTALSAIKPKGFDVIITDYKMHAVNGFELTKHFRDGGFDGLVIMISSVSNLNQKDMDALRIDAFFEKPFSIFDIHDKIKEWEAGQADNRHKCDHQKDMPEGMNKFAGRFLSNPLIRFRFGALKKADFESTPTLNKDLYE